MGSLQGVQVRCRKEQVQLWLFLRLQTAADH